MAEPIKLTEGAYEARSYTANCQRCVNLYPEANTPDSPFPFTFYQTPGTQSRFVPLRPGAARCAYRASNGTLYYVVGQDVYFIPVSYVGVKLGEIGTTSTPVKMSDNGTTIVLVDGSPQGYLIDLATNAFSAYTAAGFLGADNVDYLDTFFLFNQPNTRNFYSSLSNTTAIDPTYVAAKTGGADPLTWLAVVHGEITLLGTVTSEIWANTGQAAFPFTRIPGVFLQAGAAAPYSVCMHNQSVFWVAQDKEGKSFILEYVGYTARKISTPAIEFSLSTYSQISDAVGFTYSQAGHVFVVFNFPAADKTWVWDLTVGKWHERSYVDSDGVPHRARAQCAAFCYGENLVGDWETGELGAFLLTKNSELNHEPIVRTRSFPHIVNNGLNAVFNQFTVDMETGDTGGVENFVFMRYSNSRGKLWSSPEERSLGVDGEYAISLNWRGQGIARDMVYEISWSGAVNSCLSGAWLEAEPCAT